SNAVSDAAHASTRSPATCARGARIFQLRTLVQSPRSPVPATAAMYTNSSAPQRAANGQNGNDTAAATDTAASSHTPARARREGLTVAPASAGTGGRAAPTGCAGGEPAGKPCPAPVGAAGCSSVSAGSLPMRLSIFESSLSQFLLSAIGPHPLLSPAPVSRTPDSGEFALQTISVNLLIKIRPRHFENSRGLGNVPVVFPQLREQKRTLGRTLELLEGAALEQ